MKLLSVLQYEEHNFINYIFWLWPSDGICKAKTYPANDKVIHPISVIDQSITLVAVTEFGDMKP
jgi:hypothetical protein